MKYLKNSDIEIIRNLASAKSNIKISQGVTGDTFSKLSSKNSNFEFNEYSIYNQGESIRFIDWKVYARKEKLFIKNFLDEKRKIFDIFVDVSGSIGCNEEYKIFFIRSVLYLCGILLCRNGILNLKFLASKKIFEETKSKFESLVELDELFSKIQFDGKNINVDEFTKNISLNNSKSQFLFFCSDFLWEKKELEIILSLLENIKQKKIFFHILPLNIKDIINNHFELELIDSEDGQKFNINPGEFKKIIESTYFSWLNGIYNLLSNRDIFYIKISDLQKDITQIFRFL